MRIKHYLVLFLILLSLPAFCAENSGYKTAPAFVRVTTNMLGYNFIVKKVAQSILRQSLSTEMSGDYKIKFDSFSGVDLKKGKFKGLTIQGENLSVEDELYITKLFMKTTSDFNYVDYTKDPIEFKTDVPMAFAVEVSESDLNKTLTMGKTFNTISSLIPLVSIDKPKVKLEKEKIRINSAIKLPFSKSLKFSMSACMKVENGKVVLTNVESSKGQSELAARFVELINSNEILNNMNIGLFKGTDTNVNVQNVRIDKDKVYVDGTVVMKKAE